MVKSNDDVQRVSYSVRIDPELIKYLKHAAVDANKPVSTLIEEGIRLILKKYKK